MKNYEVAKIIFNFDKAKASLDETVDKIHLSLKTESLDFANWLNNNWYVPANDGMWRIEVENEEYDLEAPKVNIFTTEDLYSKFQNKEGAF